MAGEVAVIGKEKPRAEVALSRGALIVADALTQEAEQRKLLGQYVAHHMTEGTDFGVIPGTKNKTLLKPGAEKLTQLFRCIPRFTVDEKVENWESGLFHYRFTCQIVTQADGTVVAEGVGSCSTYESRYRYREAQRTCPQCGKAAIIKGKAEFGGGWLCFKRKDGCGAKFADDAAAITSQSVGRVQNPDILDCVNTVLKMAKKRALVDAAIALARCSDIFTQDAEDFAEAHAPEPDKAPVGRVSQPPARDPEPTPPPPPPVTREKFDALLKQKGVAWEKAVGLIEVKQKAGYTAQTPFAGLKPEHVASFTRWLERQPDATPAATTKPAVDRAAALAQFTAACDDADMSAAAIIHHHAVEMGWPADAVPDLEKLTAAELLRLAGLIRTNLQGA